MCNYLHELSTSAPRNQNKIYKKRNDKWRCTVKMRGEVWFDAHLFLPLSRWHLSITHRRFKQHKRAITEQFNLSCFCAHTLGVCDATAQVAVTANSQSSLSTNSSQMTTFGPPSDKVISPSLLSGGLGDGRGL